MYNLNKEYSDIIFSNPNKHKSFIKYGSVYHKSINDVSCFDSCDIYRKLSNDEKKQIKLKLQKKDYNQQLVKKYKQPLNIEVNELKSDSNGICCQICEQYDNLIYKSTNNIYICNDCLKIELFT